MPALIFPPFRHYQYIISKVILKQSSINSVLFPELDLQAQKSVNPNQLSQNRLIWSSFKKTTVLTHFFRTFPFVPPKKQTLKECVY